VKDKPYFAVVYMFIITAFFSSILILFARATRGQVETNEQIAFEKAVLQAFPGIDAKTNTEIHDIFTNNFEKAAIGYVYMKDNQIAGYAVPVEGQGFWAPIKGVVGIAPDKKTITGIAFYEQSETPGLGARIVEPDFRGKFEGLALGDKLKPIGIRQAGAELKNNEVHAISGATQTCVRLEKLMNDDLTKWLQEQEGN
jgi:Na+-transporting NADH:ubiquinone oxidoreductase subunit C